jgi:hypothetical protein
MCWRVVDMLLRMLEVVMLLLEEGVDVVVGMVVGGTVGYTEVGYV